MDIRYYARKLNDQWENPKNARILKHFGHPCLPVGRGHRSYVPLTKVERVNGTMA
jgi:hypothetical protein